MIPRRARDKMLRRPRKGGWRPCRWLVVETELVPGEGTGDPPRVLRTASIECD